MPTDDDLPWDALIAGAGVAGAVTACLLVRRGWRVLLVEKSNWPRDKVCGGCINAAGVALLHELGLGHVLREGEPLRHFALHANGQKLNLQLPPGIGISREQLDGNLVTAAVHAGAHFQSATTARLLPQDNAQFRTVELRAPACTHRVHARLVLAADGIAGTLLQHEPWAAWHIARNPFFGVASTLHTTHPLAPPVPKNTIAMHVGPGGYVGLVRLPAHRTHLAAALDPAACRGSGGPLPAIQRILQANLPPLQLRGTGLLTRHRPILGNHRVLALGDATGYVEPFTGEGIAWALRSARELVPLLPPQLAAWPADLPARWTATHRRTIRTRQRWCHLLRHLMHRPALAAAGIRAGNAIPSIAAALAASIGTHSLPHLKGARP